MLHTISAVTAVAALALATAVTAQNAPASRGDISPDGRMAMHISGLVLADLGQFIPDTAVRDTLFLRMTLLAKQEAIGASCASYDVDQQRMAMVMMRTMSPLSDGVGKDLATARVNRALRQYHTLLGGELAQFAHDPDGYCAHSGKVFAEISSDPDQQSVKVLKPS